MEARDLPSADSNGLSDPFFWIFFNNDNETKRESAVVYKSLNPKFSEDPYEL